MRAFILVGPTASGKTEVAHRIARANGWPILSADSMLVYRDMDLGTAKPTPAEQDEVRYWGIDLVTPDQPFSVGAYVEHVRTIRKDLSATDQPVIVVGGTGLYVKCLTEGLDDLPAARPDLREEYEALLEEGGIEALCERLTAVSPEALEGLQDPDNPRRVMRALEIAETGGPSMRSWDGGSKPRLTGLNWPRDMLYSRIEERAKGMFSAGLLGEVCDLHASYSALSHTAAQAIGYREAREHLDGRIDLEEAILRTVQRTRRLAKRQLTWFRHQADVDWVGESGVADDIDRITKEVKESWERHGPVELAI